MASFLSNLFGGGDAAEAARKNGQLYQQYGQQGQGYLDNGLQKSLASLGQGYGAANNTLAGNRDVYGNYGATAGAALDTGLGASLGALGQAKSEFDPLAALGQKYGAGTSLYLDSLGVNGAAGNANAAGAYTHGLGFESQLNTGIDTLNRRRAAAGMLNSGNADIDAITFGNDLAKRDYGAWQDRLAGLISPELSATSGAATGRAGVDTNIANLFSQDAQSRVGVAGNVASGMAGTNTAIAGNQVGLGAGQAGLYGQNASDLVNLQGNVTSGQASANTAEAAAKQQGMKNLLSLGTSLAGLAAGGGFGGLGGMMGAGGGLGSTLGSLGITYGLPGTRGSNLYGPVA